MAFFQRRNWIIVFLLLVFLDLSMLGWLLLHDKLTSLSASSFTAQCSSALPGRDTCSSNTVQKILDLIGINQGNIVIPTGETSTGYSQHKVRKIQVTFDCVLKGKKEYLTYTKEQKLLSASTTGFTNGNLDIKIGFDCDEISRFGSNRDRFVHMTLLESLYPFAEGKWKAYQHRRNPALAADISNTVDQLDRLHLSLFSDQ